MLTELALLALLVLAYLVLRDRKPPGMPPGPWEVPFLGNRIIFNVKYMLGLRDIYGDVVTTRVMKHRTVLIYDHQLAKEVLASTDFVDRPAVFQAMSLDDRKKGGVTANGAQWQHDRRFVLRNLRDLGMGKTSLEAGLHAEAEALVEDLRAYGGSVVEDTPISLRTVALNVIWQMVAGIRFDLRSSEVMAYFGTLTELRKKLTPLTRIFFFIPQSVKKFIPRSIQIKYGQVDLLENFFNEKRTMVNKFVEKGEEKIKNGMDGEDLISEYLREMKQHEDEPDSPFWRGALMQSVDDLFGAGSDTIFNMLKWKIYLLAKYPELVKEMREQIESVTPKGTMISLTYKSDMPLVEAFVTESLRYASMLVFNPQRSATRDTHIRGYFIPKGTMVQAVNLYIHRDPKIWENPEDFNPRRFINDEGKFCAPKEGLFAFGSGRRVCIGETLAKMELLLFTAALIQNFDIKVPEGSKINTDIEESAGTRLPKNQPFIFDYRN